MRINLRTVMLTIAWGFYVALAAMDLWALLQ